MRKASWGAVAMAIYGFGHMPPVAALPVLGKVLTFAALAGYILLSLDPPTSHPRQRQMLWAGFGCALASLLVVATLAIAKTPESKAGEGALSLLAVAILALPLWLANRGMQAVFSAGAATAAVSPFLAGDGLLGPASLASAAGFGLAAAGAAWIAFRLEHPATASSERKVRTVVAYDILRLSPEEKAARLERIEQRYRDGEIPEHKYWDLRQELESR